MYWRYLFDAEFGGQVIQESSLLFELQVFYPVCGLIISIISHVGNQSGVFGWIEHRDCTFAQRRLSEPVTVQQPAVGLRQQVRPSRAQTLLHQPFWFSESNLLERQEATRGRDAFPHSGCRGCSAGCWRFVVAFCCSYLVTSNRRFGV